MKNSLTFGFALILILIAVNAYVTNETLDKLSRNQMRIIEQQGIRLEIVSIVAALTDAETAQRGFLLTGNEQYLEPYLRSVRELALPVRRLRSNAAPLDEIAAIRKEVEVPFNTKLEEMEETVALRRAGKVAEAEALVRTNKGKVAMDKIREYFMEIDRAKNVETLILRGETERGRSRVRILSTTSAVVVGMAVCGLFFLTIRNILDRERLLRAAREAGDSLGKALASERAAHSEATHANKLKDEFISVVSHELRTPLNAIVGWTTLLRDGAQDEDELREGLATIDRNARAQARLIDDLLDVSRIMTGKVRLQISEVSLRDVIVSVAEGLRPAAEALGVAINVSTTVEPSDVLGDVDRLQQVIWNLLNNAIKFTPRGGRVDVSLFTSDSRVAVEVVDTGKGIRPDFLPRIFDRFSQQDSSTTRDQVGLGLGLAISRHLVELHGGRISASSPGEGMGAKFRIEIPVVAVREMKRKLASRTYGHDAVEREQKSIPDGALNGLRVLAVDDQADTLSVIKRVLGRAGAEVRVATSVAEGLSTLSEFKAELVISDIGMPGKDGYTFIKDLRDHRDPCIREIRCIAVTAFAREQDRKMALDAGFQDHLAKPVDVAQLIEKVARVSGRI